MTTALHFWILNWIQSINCIQGDKNNQHIAWLFLHLININPVLFCLKLYISSLPRNSPPQICFSSNTVKELIQNFLFPQDLCLQLMSSEFFSCIKVYVFEIWMCGFQSQLYKYVYFYQFPSVQSIQFSRSVVSDSWPPHESQHAKPPCPSPTPGVHSDSRPLSRWCHPAISSSFSPSPPAPNPSQHQSLFQWVNS